MVTEYIPGGNLFEQIQKRTKFTEYAASRVMKKLLETVALMHKNHITHLDIKPENILFPSQHDPNQIKLTDFGLSKCSDYF